MTQDSFELIGGPQAGSVVKVNERTAVNSKCRRVRFPRFTDQGIVADLYERLAYRDGKDALFFVETEAPP